MSQEKREGIEVLSGLQVFRHVTIPFQKISALQTRAWKSLSSDNNICYESIPLDERCGRDLLPVDEVSPDT